MRHLYGSCHDADCTACEPEAERRKEDPGFRDDWQTGQSRYERELDARWSA